MVRECVPPWCNVNANMQSSCIHTQQAKRCHTVRWSVKKVPKSSQSLKSPAEKRLAAAAPESEPHASRSVAPEGVL